MSILSSMELSGKYCSYLGSDVFVVSHKSNDGRITRECLSSHLCHADERICCGLGGKQYINVIRSMTEEKQNYQ